MAAISSALATPDQATSQLAPLPAALARIFSRRESYADVAFVAADGARVLYAHQGLSSCHRGCSLWFANGRAPVSLSPYRCIGLLAVRSSAQFRERYLAPPRPSSPPPSPPDPAFAGRVVAVDEQEVPFTILSHLVHYMYTNELHHITHQAELDQLFKVARCGQTTTNAERCWR